VGKKRLKKKLKLRRKTSALNGVYENIS